MSANDETGPLTEREPVQVHEGGMGFEVHLDGEFFMLVDSEMEREWGPLSFAEAAGLHDALTAAMGAYNDG